MLPLVVYKVFPDGRPDQLVRGVDIVGTPLVSLTKIVATGDTPEIFNGYCGAESGSVPVSAVAPAILISEMEVQKKETSTDRPPILPPPAHDPRSEGANAVRKLATHRIARGVRVPLSRRSPPAPKRAPAAPVRAPRRLAVPASRHRPNASRHAR